MHFEGLGEATPADPKDITFAIEQIDVFKARQTNKLQGEPAPLIPKDVHDYLFRIAHAGVPDMPGDKLAIQAARDFIGF